MEPRLSPDLPERFAVLYNYDSGKFDTPLDSLGIADIDAVFELALRTYPGELPPLTSGARDIHHLYLTEEWWKEYAAAHDPPDCKTIKEFRDSPPQKAFVPRAIHSWIEYCTVPPPPPPIEVMRRRNASWRSARLLLREAINLENAVMNYQTKRDKPRRLLGHIDGITPMSKRKEQQYIEVTDNAYLLSELNERIASWKERASTKDIPPEDRILLHARTAHVRALGSRMRNGAMVPRIPASLRVA